MVGTLWSANYNYVKIIYTTHMHPNLDAQHPSRWLKLPEYEVVISNEPQRLDQNKQHLNLWLVHPTTVATKQGSSRLGNITDTDRDIAIPWINQTPMLLSVILWKNYKNRNH